MTYKFSAPLPTLRWRIRQGFTVMIGLNAVFGIIMIGFIFASSGITPKVIHRNYDSIAASLEMRKAWDQIQDPEAYRRKPLSELIKQFNSAMSFEEGNITESGEAAISQEVRALWEKTQKTSFQILISDHIKMHTLLDRLVNLNEQGMFQLAEKSANLSRRVWAMSIAFLILTLIFAIYLSDGLAMRLSQPLKDMAEVLKQDPSLEKGLKLAKPTSLEMRILVTELTGLWQRLGTFQKLNIEELAAQRERLETVLASVEDAILVLDNNGCILHSSEGMLRLLNLSSEMITGESWTDLSTASDNYFKLRQLLGPDMVDDTAVEIEFSGVKKIFSGRHRDILTQFNHKIGTVYLLHDITETKQRERLKSEFIGVLSHELKTPLQSLGTAAELLAKRVDSMNEDSKMLVETINDDVARIRAVANDFMQVGMTEQHLLKLRLENHPLSQLLQEWMKPFKVIAKDKGVHLEFQKEGADLIWAKIDVIKFPWAISNLLANAIRISKPETKVTVYITDREGEKVQVEIRDEGPGISEQIQKRMFEPYFQAPPTEDGPAAGYLGLGLTIAKEVIEAHEGTLSYISKRPHGSIFRISLPLVIIYT